MRRWKPNSWSKTSDGRFDTHGAFYRGFHMDLGPSACLSLGGVRIVVASNKVQMADQEMFRFAGVDPARAAILVVKVRRTSAPTSRPSPMPSWSARRLDPC